MEANREVKIAIVVGLIMLTACLVAFIIYKEKTKPTLDLDLKVYKHVMTSAKEGTYYECRIETTELAKMNVEFLKIMNLKDSKMLEPSIDNTINGDYKVVSGSNYIAFDSNNTKNLVYRNDTTGLYRQETNLYENIEKACAYITSDSVEPKEQEQQKDTKKDKKDTKKDTKKKSTKKTTKK